MPIRHALWKIGNIPQLLGETMMETEKLLEDMIVAAPEILSDEWMLIGQQEDTGFGGRIDLLGIAPDGTLVLIELKRNKTPREIVAQALDYATWVEKLQAADIASIYRRFKKNNDANLITDFKTRFKADLDETTLNASHQIVLVSASLDASTERIVSYLSARGLAINVLCFQVFQNGDDKLLSRAWLLDPAMVQPSLPEPSGTSSEPWNGEFYASFGHGESRNWDEAVNYGFFCAGGGTWYSKTLRQLKPGSRIWVRVPQVGYVGVGRVTGYVQPASEFTLGGTPILELVNQGTYHKEHLDDPEHCEYFVPVQWLDVRPLNDAVQETGLFGLQHSICRPTTSKWITTIERLKEKFPQYNSG